VCDGNSQDPVGVEELRGSLGPVANPGGVRGMLLVDCLGESRMIEKVMSGLGRECRRRVNTDPLPTPES
jgi:hypothetical protein